MVNVECYKHNTPIFTVQKYSLVIVLFSIFQNTYGSLRAPGERSFPDLLPSSRPPDRRRAGYPTPGAAGGSGAAGPLLKGGVLEGGRGAARTRSNQPWRGYASARE